MNYTYKAGKTAFDPPIFASRPLVREVIMLEFSRELLRLRADKSVDPTACRNSLGSSGESNLHHCIVRSADVNIYTGKLEMSVWPSLRMVARTCQLPMGSCTSTFPAWIVMDMHHEEFSSGRTFVRLRGMPRVPAETMDRLDMYYAELACPETLKKEPEP